MKGSSSTLMTAYASSACKPLVMDYSTLTWGKNVPDREVELEADTSGLQVGCNTSSVEVSCTLLLDNNKGSPGTLNKYSVKHGFNSTRKTATAALVFFV